MLYYLFRIYFLTTLDIYKTYFKSRHIQIQRPRVYFFSVRSYCICTPQGFVTMCFLIFIIDEVKNFTANNNHSSCWSQSRTRICAKELVINVCNKGKQATTRSSPIGYWSKSSIVSWYFGIGQDNGKIPHTCNHLIIDQWILRSSDLKFTQGVFTLLKVFPICQQITMSI